MRTTIPRAGGQSAQDSYGPKSHPPRVTGNRQNQRMAGKLGRRIGYRTSNERHSSLFREFGCNLTSAWRTPERSITIQATETCRDERAVKAPRSNLLPLPSAQLIHSLSLIHSFTLFLKFADYFRQISTLVLCAQVCRFGNIRRQPAFWFRLPTALPAPRKEPKII